MPNQPNNDILHPVNLVLPVLTTAVINTLVADVGSIVYDSTKNKISICINKAAGAANWEDVTSA